MAIRCPPGIRCHGSVIQGILPQAREKLESDYRIELEERVGGSRERPRAIRAHEWTQGDVKQNMRQIEEILNDTRFQRVEQEPFESFLVIRGMSMAAYIQAACKEKSFRL